MPSMSHICLHLNMELEADVAHLLFLTILKVSVYFQITGIFDIHHSLKPLLFILTYRSDAAEFTCVISLYSLVFSADVTQLNTLPYNFILLDSTQKYFIFCV